MNMQKWQKMINELSDEEDEAAPVDDEERYNAAYIKGTEKHSAGDLDSAVDLWGEALALDPSDAKLWWNRGAVRGALGDLDGAIADLSEAVARDPTMSDAWFSRGQMKSDKGDPQGAIADFGECVRLDPKSVMAWCCRGTERLAAGDAAGAAADADAALRIDETAAAAWGLRGAAKQRLQDYAGAIEDCKRALKLEPDMQWVRASLETAEENLLASTAKAEMDKEDAVWDRMLGQFVEHSDPSTSVSSASSHREQGNTCFKQGDLQGAIVAYTKACQHEEPEWVLALSNMAICHLKLHDYHAAVEAAELCLRQRGAPPKARLTKFKALAAQRDWITAFAELRDLRSQRGVGTDVTDAAEREELQKRKERVALCAAKKSGEDVVVNFGDDESQAQCDAEGAVASLARRSLSLVGAVEQAVSTDLDISTVDIVNAQEEEPFALGQLPQLAEETRIRMVGPLVKREHDAEETKIVSGKTLRITYLKGRYPDLVTKSDAPDLAILYCPDLSTHFDDWAPIIKHLIGMNVLTVVTGDNLDQSLVENEDLLRALGCSITVPTARSARGHWMLGDCKNYHVTAFQGGMAGGLSLIPALKQRLAKRGFQFPAS